MIYSKNMKLIMGCLLCLQIFLIACDKAKDRVEVINPKIQNNLILKTELHEITSENASAYFYLNEHNDQKIYTKIDSLQVESLPKIKINSEIQKVIDLVKIEGTKNDLETHLKSGYIAFLILEDQLKIFKVVSKKSLEKKLNMNQFYSFTDLINLKNPSDSTTVNNDTDEHEKVRKEKKLKFKRLIRNNNYFEEVATIKISKSGVLESQKTEYYNEKTSILNIVERPSDLSTHIILDKQISPIDLMLTQ